MSIDEANRIHFIGIGGIGMSALARLFLHAGKVVTGSDATTTPITCGLEALGIDINFEQTADNITDGIDFVVYTEAMPQNHPELVAARDQGIETVNYFQALGMVANQYYLIAVAGTHGKSTTTAMLTDILEEASFDPTAVIGTLRSKTGSNFRPGKSKYFIAEACEYKEDFKYLKPDVLVITNIEHEHVDYYHDLAAVQQAFKRLVDSVPPDGAIITQASDENIVPVLEDSKATVVDYNKNIDLTLELSLPGLHNRLNAAAASAAAAFVGVEKPFIKTALENFVGTWRRFEYKGQINNAPIYEDYAHHPTEIKASIAGAREKYPDKHLVVVFQPHTYSRSEELFDDFVAALSKADRVLMVPIYAAREKNLSGVSSKILGDKIAENGVHTEHFETLQAAALSIKESVNINDVVMVMGAGDVTKVTEELTK